MSNSSDPLDCCSPGPLWIGFLRHNTGVGCHFLLQGIFPIQGLNPYLLHAGRFFTAEPSEKPSYFRSEAILTPEFGSPPLTWNSKVPWALVPTAQVLIYSHLFISRINTFKRFSKSFRAGMEPCIVDKQCIFISVPSTWH